MPLYIDLHIDSKLTPDLIKQCHVADKSIQEKYGVRYLQILHNQPQGYLFCLIEGPDKEACARVHQEAHGNISCNILEITQSDFSAIVAGKQKDGFDFTLNSDGSIDTGNRTILFVDILGPRKNAIAVSQLVYNALLRSEGKNCECFENQFMVMFDSPRAALNTGLHIANTYTTEKTGIEIRLGISIGPLLKEDGDFLEEVRKSAFYFSFVSDNGQATASSRVNPFIDNEVEINPKRLKVLHHQDEIFIKKLLNCVEEVWDKDELCIIELARSMAMSKSQLTRKLKSVISYSPNELLKEYRLRKAIHFMEKQNMNITQVAMATGFTNPSYFTKCFRKRFGKLPSDFMNYN